MSDDHQPPTQKPSASEPLQYWHSTDPAPLHPALLTLVTIGGFLLGAGIVIVAGFFTGLAVLDGASGHKAGAQVIGIAIDLTTLGVFVRLILKVRRGRVLALEARRRAARFFAIGMLLGCGLACLLEGICFTATGFS